MAITWKLITCAASLSCFPAGSTFAADISGVVESSTAKYATVLSNSNLIPAPGDKAEIYFKVPGADVEVSVASGHVYEITGPNIMVQIDQATGTVAKNQLVRIISPNPKTRSEAAAAASPTGLSTPLTAPSVAPTKTLPPSIPFPTPSQVDSAVAECVNRGIAAYSKGDIDGAIAAYTDGINIAPGLAVLYLNRANAYLFKPDFKAAIADANKAIELKVEKLDDAYVIRGSAKSGEGQYRAAIADCNRALEINPRYPLAYNNRANDELRLHDLRSALADCNTALALDPNLALAYYNRGYVYTNIGWRANAVADWKRAMELQPAFAAELLPLIAKLSPPR